MNAIDQEAQTTQIHLLTVLVNGSPGSECQHGPVETIFLVCICLPFFRMSSGREKGREREKIRREGERVCVCSPLGLMLIN